MAGLGAKAARALLGQPLSVMQWRSGQPVPSAAAAWLP